MVVFQTTSKHKASKSNPISNLKDSIETDSLQLHLDYRKRYKALAMDQGCSKVPVRLIVTVALLMLCVFNVFWGVSSVVPFITRMFSGKSSSEDNWKRPGAIDYISSTFNGISVKLRGSAGQNSTAPGTIKEAPLKPMKSKPKVPNSALPVVNGQLGKMNKKSKPESAPKTSPTMKKKAKKPRPQMLLTETQTIPVYYVNLDAAVDRRTYIEAQLREQHLQSVRVPAMDSSENVTVSLVSPLTVAQPNDRELACIASHMVALHKAVNDQSFFPSSPYAIIIEDDVSFEFPVNWNELLYNAPEDFDVVQLMTSNAEQVISMADSYQKAVTWAIAAAAEEGEASAVGEGDKVSNVTIRDKIKHENLWSTRVRTSNLWSTQAYAVRKDNVRRIINSLVRRNEASRGYSVSIKNTPNQVAYCKELNARSCKLLYPFRLVADVYLYDLLGVAYAIKLPLFNGAVGFNSSIQTTVGDKQANMSFANIGGVVDYVRRNSEDLLPSRLLLRSTNHSVA